MKITVGLGSIDDYVPFVQAGAGEMFCGYIPDWWNEKYGRAVSLNRREVSYYNVQIGSRSELQILSGMIREYGVPVTIALNSLNYGQEGTGDVCRVVEECMEEGFRTFILADPAVIFLLRKKYSENVCRIHLSGELGEMNSGVLRMFAPMGISRVIFHRKVSIREMKRMVEKDEKVGREYEAFALNEMCHFHGGFCNSIHCDELPHMCLVPYRLGKVVDYTCRQHEVKNIGELKNTELIKNSSDNREWLNEGSEENITEADNLKNCNSKTCNSKTCNSKTCNPDECRDVICPSESCNPEAKHDTHYPVIGASGCGLCALYELREVGITHLKLVSRGNYAEDTLRDIQGMKKALQILEKSSSKEEYIQAMKETIFSEGCSGNCYYR